MNTIYSCTPKRAWDNISLRDALRFIPPTFILIYDACVTFSTSHTRLYLLFRALFLLFYLLPLFSNKGKRKAWGRGYHVHMGGASIRSMVHPRIIWCIHYIAKRMADWILLPKAVLLLLLFSVLLYTVIFSRSNEGMPSSIHAFVRFECLLYGSISLASRPTALTPDYTVAYHCWSPSTMHYW